MALASTGTVILGTFAFTVFWILATFPAFPGLPIGRTAGAILGAALMVIFQVASPDAAYNAVDLPILGLLFGTMVVSVYLERADMFKYLEHALSWKCRGGKDLLCRLCFLIALSSAIFTNDTCCVVFTEFILKLCREKNLPPEPFLIALASSANLGSSATPIGNPQNLVIAIQSKIRFGTFVAGIFPAMLVGVIVNTGFILLIYWNQLSSKPPQATVDVFEVTNGCMHSQQPTDLENAGDVKRSFDEPDLFESCRSLDFVVEEKDRESQNLAKSIYSTDAFPEKEVDGSYGVNILDGVIEGSQGIKPSQDEMHASSIQVLRVSFGSKSEREIHRISSARVFPACESPPPCLENKESVAQDWKRTLRKTCVYLVTTGMLIALLAGLNLSWSALSAAIALMVMDFADAGPNLDKVSYSLLVFFSGMFITVDGFNRTGLPGEFWDAMEPHARINHASGMAVLTAVVLLLSNIASNVPTVLLLGPRVAASAAALSEADVTKSWLILAWASTIAGNLTLVGSAANLIVCEKARTVPYLHYHLSFWRHFRFGFPATLLIVSIGLPMIR